MKNLVKVAAVMVIVGMMAVNSVSADSFSAFFGNGAWSFSMRFGHYDYYNRYSPGFYDSGTLDFHSALAPYGTWRYIPELGGMVWIPFVPPGWRPYSYGAWSYTSYGWTWTAYEPWGWIPHHYGNWMFHPVFGWVWVPGYTWAPAHVAWGYFNGYYGWAPLPPRQSAFYHSYHRDNRYEYNRSYHWYSYSSSGGSWFSSGERREEQDFDHYEWIPNDAWVIVSSAQFMNDNIIDVAVQPENNLRIFEKRSFRLNANPPVRSTIERDTRRSIPVMEVDEVTKKVDGKQVKVVRPQKIDADRSRKIGSVYQNFISDDLRNSRASQDDPVNRQAPSVQQKPYVPAPAVSPASRNETVQDQHEQQLNPSRQAPGRYTQPRPPVQQPPAQLPAQQHRMEPQRSQPQRKAPPERYEPPRKSPEPRSNTGDAVQPNQGAPGQRIEPSRDTQPKPPVNQPGTTQKQPDVKPGRKNRPVKDEAPEEKEKDRNRSLTGQE